MGSTIEHAYTCNLDPSSNGTFAGHFLPGRVDFRNAVVVREVGKVLSFFVSCFAKGKCRWGGSCYNFIRSSLNYHVSCVYMALETLYS